MDWVLDASIALGWALPDETSLQADRFLRRVSAKDVLWVPSLWWYEVANASDPCRASQATHRG